MKASAKLFPIIVLALVLIPFANAAYVNPDGIPDVVYCTQGVDVYVYYFDTDAPGSPRTKYVNNSSTDVLEYDSAPTYDYVSGAVGTDCENENLFTMVAGDFTKTIGVSSGTSTVSTSTMFVVDNGQYLFNGILLFLIIFFGLLFYFKTHYQNSN